MFMLAATTASIVLYKWLGSENFASGSRLKMSEAQQASESGLDAVRAWLQYKAPDVGAVLGEHLASSTKPAYKLNHSSNNILGGSVSIFRKQNYDVYLLSADTVSKPYKLKFMSVGRGRDGSEIKQTAIFSVDGLYNINVPKQMPSIQLSSSSTPSSASPAPAGNVPAYFGGIGAGTQGNMTSGYIIGDVNATSGFSSTGDVIVTGSLTYASGAQIGCPIRTGSTKYSASNDAYPNPYPGTTTFGNAYIRENLIAQQSGYCGNVYVGGNMTVSGTTRIWGDLYVNGNLTLDQELIVYGNVTVNGNITINTSNPLEFKKNLVLPNASSSYTTTNSKNITVNGTTCKVGSNNPFVTNSVTTHATCNTTTGADRLTYLGDQISTNKVGGKYVINDPIQLGNPTGWKTATLPASCTWPPSLTITGGVIQLNTTTIPGTTEANDFATAVNNCYTSSAGNWTSPSNSTKWLVIRVNWDAPNSLQNVTLNGNIIIVVTNKPGDNTRLPYTGSTSNVLLYLTQGADIIYIENPNANSRNYFIYSEGDINTINGSQYLKGNLFMANGTKVNTMQDPTIIVNQPLFDALSNAGVIVSNPNKCVGAACASGTSSSSAASSSSRAASSSSVDYGINLSQPAIYGKDDYIIPLSPRLKVELKSKYISSEIEPSSASAVAKTALVMPRYVNVAADKAFTGGANDLSKYYNILYLNKKTPISPAPTFSCYGTPGTTNAGVKTPGATMAQDVYTCEPPSGTNISPFYLKVYNAYPSSSTTADPDGSEIKGNITPADREEAKSSSSPGCTSPAGCVSSSSSVPGGSGLCYNGNGSCEPSAGPCLAYQNITCGNPGDPDMGTVCYDTSNNYCETPFTTCSGGSKKPVSNAKCENNVATCGLNPGALPVKVHSTINSSNYFTKCGNSSASATFVNPAPIASQVGSMNITATVACDGRNQTVYCTAIVVDPEGSSSSASTLECKVKTGNPLTVTAGTTGATIDPSSYFDVLCGGTAASPVTFYPPGSTVLSQGTTTFMAEASCSGLSQTAICNTITVNAPSSSSVVVSSSSSSSTPATVNVTCSGVNGIYYKDQPIIPTVKCSDDNSIPVTKKVFAVYRTDNTAISSDNWAAIVSGGDTSGVTLKVTSNSGRGVRLTKVWCGTETTARTNGTGWSCGEVTCVNPSGQCVPDAPAANATPSCELKGTSAVTAGTQMSDVFAVKCGTTTLSSGFTFNPTSLPSSGNLNVQAKITASGNCQDKAVSCPAITITAPSSSSTAPSSSSTLTCTVTQTQLAYNTPIGSTHVATYCNGTLVPTGITYNPATTYYGTIHVRVTANCGGSSQTATCSNNPITVDIPSNSSSSTQPELACAVQDYSSVPVNMAIPNPDDRFHITCGVTRIYASSITWDPQFLVPPSPGTIRVAATPNTGLCAGDNALCNAIPVHASYSSSSAATTTSSSSVSSSSSTPLSSSSPAECIYTAKGDLGKTSTTNFTTHTCPTGYEFYFVQTGDAANGNGNGNGRSVKVSGGGTECNGKSASSHYTWNLGCATDGSTLTITNNTTLSGGNNQSTIYCLNLACCPSGSKPSPSTLSSPLLPPLYCTVQSSSSSTPSSSSSTPSSSSTIPELVCTGGPASETAGNTVDTGTFTVKCGNTPVTATFGNTSATTVTPLTVTATATCGGSSKTVNCTPAVPITPQTPTCGSTISGTYTVGQSITAPTILCNGKPVTTFDWNGAPAWSNLAQGSFSPTATVTENGLCTGGTTLSCASITVNDNVLSCAWGSKPITDITTVAAGTAITPPTVTCNGTNVTSTASFSGQPASWNSSTATPANSYTVTASDNACPGKTIQCGIIKVVKLSCGTIPANNAYVKPGSTINDLESIVSCSPSGTIKSTAGSSTGWSGLPGTGVNAWKVPDNALKTDSYTISASDRKCDDVSVPSAECGIVRVAGITCDSIQNTVLTTGKILKPTVTCNNSATPSQVKFYNGTTQLTSFPNDGYQLPVGVANGTVYNLKAEADCGSDSWLTGLKDNCSTITASTLICEPHSSWTNAVAGATIQAPTIRCGSTEISAATAGNITWKSPGPTTWNVAFSAGTYNASATLGSGAGVPAACKGATVSCDPLVVASAPSSSSVTITCNTSNWTKTCFSRSEGVPRPNVYCNGTLMTATGTTNAEFSLPNNTGTSGLANWNQNTSVTFSGSQRDPATQISLLQFNCGSGMQAVPSGSQSCGMLHVSDNCPASSSSTASSSSATPTITCSFAKSGYTLGENIPPPTITCSNGSTLVKTNANFTNTAGNLPTDVNNWRTTGNAYYSSLLATTNTITVNNVTCGGANPSGLPTSCGSITLSNPTCTGVSGTTTTGTTITPTVTCGSATKSGNPTFTISGGNGGTWSDNGAGGGSFTSTGTNKTVNLATVTCDSHPISGLNVSCGTITSITTAAACYAHPQGSVPSDAMNQCIQKDGKCYKCIPSNNNCTNSWFWGGTWDNNWPSQGWLNEVSCSTGAILSSSSSSAGACSNPTAIAGSCADNGYDENKNANWVEPNVSVNSCYKYNCQGQLAIGNWTTGDKTVKVTGCGSDVTKTITASSWATGICTATGDINIQVTAGSGNMQIRCDNHAPCKSSSSSGTSITIAAGSGGANGATTINAPSGGGQATFNITCTNTSQSLDCNRGSNTMLRFSTNGGSSWVTQSSNNNPVQVMNPCKSGTSLIIDFGNDATAITCNNRGSYW